jgi:YjbE family integral membrane protein
VESFVVRLVGIIVINLLLSGDNAVVIGMAVRGLPGALKRRAILIGGVGALVLRVVLTGLAALLLQVPLLQAAGGLMLAWITYRLLIPSADAADPFDPDEHMTFGLALRVIIIADLTMSLDNVLAVGAAAGGDLLLLTLGLGLSMAIIMLGGSVIGSLLDRLSWLVYVGALVLLVVAGDLLAADPVVQGLLGTAGWVSWGLTGLPALGVTGALLVRLALRARHAHATHAV